VDGVNGSFVAVIGAGPAGLAVAAHLLDRRVPFVVIERAGAAGSSWRGRYSRLHLHTVPAASALPFWGFPSHFPTYVSAGDLAAYYDGYARTVLGDHVLYGATVTSALPPTHAAPRPGLADRGGSDGGDEWVVTVRRSDGADLVLRPSAVVVATGQEGAPFEPPIPGARDGTFPGKVLHSAAWRGAETYRGQRALVVGFGNSGAEIAMDLWEHGALNVTVVARSPVNLMPRWFMERYPHGHALLRQLERWHTPAWLSDALARFIVYPLLYPDLEGLGLRLSAKGVKSSLLQDHRPPVLDIGIIDLVRRGEVKVQPRALASLGPSGDATFCDNIAMPPRCSSAPFDVVVLATGYAKASRTSSPHAQFLPPAVLATLASAHGQIESGPVPKGPVPGDGLWFCGFSDHVGRLQEIAWEAPAIVSAIVAAGKATPWPTARAASYEELHLARFTPRVCTATAV
jgi:hypothetical protein